MIYLEKNFNKICLIIGWGSIGKRHYQVLQKYFKEIIVVSRHMKGKNFFDSIHKVPAIEQVDYVVIANETSEHKNTLEDVRVSVPGAPILVEKPLFLNLHEVNETVFQQVYVGYNLRFSKVTDKIRSFLRNNKVFYADFYAGQYLPSWRPESDYKNSYSSKSEKGGGVLRDLSHEIDLCLSLMGPYQNCCGLMKKVSDLHIETEDVAIGVLETMSGSLCTIRVDYLNTEPTRVVTLHTEHGTIVADYNKNTVDTPMEKFIFESDRNYSYDQMHKNILGKKLDYVCNYHDGIKVMKIIEKIEVFNNLGSFIK